jgi:hypothetical protein
VDVTEPRNEDPLLTLDQAYRAAYYFIRQYYERDALKPESMFFLLVWMQLDAPRSSSDPAQWHDWLRSVEKSLAGEDNALSSEGLPEPRSQRPGKNSN